MARIRTHPGTVLRAELDARAMSANQLALALRVPANRITAILRGDRSISAETAVRLGRYLGTGAAFWMNLQTAHDISEIEAEKGRTIEKEIPAAIAWVGDYSRRFAKEPLPPDRTILAVPMSPFGGRSRSSPDSIPAGSPTAPPSWCRRSMGRKQISDHLPVVISMPILQ